MKWPNHTDYQDAMQDPKTCFAEADLQLGEPACDMLGLPKVLSGNFASVYEVKTSTGRWAIRCFVRQVAGTQARYARLSEHLETVKLPWLVNFEFILRGISVQGEWYPIVRMQWVEGLPLNLYIDEHVHEPEVMRKLADQFRALVADLRANKIAHGDFQHGNIMVTPAGELRLVDYDGMYCPAFGKKRAPELGHANFQHPLRLADYYDESLDNFSALVIYTTFLALAEDPTLWGEFYSADNLLLTSSDYRNTQNSKAFARLKANKSPDVQQLATLIQQACIAPVAFTPWFEETLVALKNGTLNESIGLLQSATPSGSGDGSPEGQPQGDGWWDNATTMRTRPADGGSRAAAPGGSPITEGSRPAPGLGSRPAPAAVPVAASSTPVAMPGGTRPAPALTGASPGTRPAPTAVSSGTRPAPTPLGGTGGTRPAPSVSPQPSSQVVFHGEGDSGESGISWKVKLAVAALILLFIIGIIVSATRTPSP